LKIHGKISLKSLLKSDPLPTPVFLRKLPPGASLWGAKTVPKMVKKMITNIIAFWIAPRTALGGLWVGLGAQKGVKGRAQVSQNSGGGGSLFISDRQKHNQDQSTRTEGSAQSRPRAGARWRIFQDAAKSNWELVNRSRFTGTASNQTRAQTVEKPDRALEPNS